ncbi:hypothetical protein [Streptomyces clavuligerus]|uniref:hypothetical protein n=1 Tax=Streptomyces clavuligerus TaxID=1901 RepID=UPI0002D744BD|nr:hypothetical protein [Streptomyces clavuligerus]MBY6301158.1 hypothetical protein [Streptomyces clavuligerus]QPJ96394.1 hypothetical protein GE265_27270 [Streptomyces clavuligerus]QPL61484.1 hypothetical protein I3J04_00505 [Streptomyces clavuligerus]QPL67525.1 hypothetical protein I3J05_00515 [Streptomyces clavuligerus]QPL73590.1 hypothetical protein I3J06_00510 [Streptomyces clavuligerus]
MQRRHRISLATATAALLILGSAGAAMADNHMPAPPHGGKGKGTVGTPAGSAGAPGSQAPAAGR